MAYSESKKLTAGEKKLQALRIQLYGKEKLPVQPKESFNPTSFSFQSDQKGQTQAGSPQASSETLYLKQDLLKIGILATLILFIQALLFMSMNRGLLNI